jgi:DNA-binding NtrC family response regulator
MTTVPIMPAPAGGVLVASPNISLREHVLQSFQQQRCPVQEACGGAEALVKLESGDWQLLYLDRRLPDLDVEELIQIIKCRFPGIRVVVVDSDGPQEEAETGFGHSATTVPAANSSSAGRNNSSDEQPLPEMVGESLAMRRVYRLARLVAPRIAAVLLVGDSGTGKELVARGIHDLSRRAGKPFVAVNCAAIPETLLESELFGYARGAFTGAIQAHAGRIHAASGGTLFLDEVGELPLGMQAKLLRFLEQKEIQRLGGTEVARVDVRVIAASNADLARKAERAEFREDLYYRLSVFPIQLPALRDRTADIIPLAEHFAKLLAASMELAGLRLSTAATRVLENHEWKGNVRELRHVMERAAILADGSTTILPEHLCFDLNRKELRNGLPS